MFVPETEKYSDVCFINLLTFYRQYLKYWKNGNKRLINRILNLYYLRSNCSLCSETAILFLRKDQRTEKQLSKLEKVKTNQLSSPETPPPRHFHSPPRVTLSFATLFYCFIPTCYIYTVKSVELKPNHD